MMNNHYRPQQLLYSQLHLPKQNRKPMKKVYDWNVQVTVHVQNSNQSINVICSVHTNIHALKIEICKKLKLQVFDTDIDLYGGRDTYKQMKPTSSLMQNGIQQNTTIQAFIRRTKQNNKLDVSIDKQVQKDTGESSTAIGLTIVASCSNPICVNYQQDLEINYGYGVFPFLQLVSNLKCELCPYKSQCLRPTMMCKSARVSKCWYQIKGVLPDRDGIPVPYTFNYKKSFSQKDIISEIWGKKPGKDILLTVKHM